MRRLVVVLMLVALAGCGKPGDIIFGADPLKQISDQGDKFKKLPENDRNMLVGYIMKTEMRRTMGAKNLPQITGKTVNEVLADAAVEKIKIDEIDRAEKAKDEERRLTKIKLEAEAAALKQQAIEEQRKVIDKINSAVLVAITDRIIIEEDDSRGIYRGGIKFKYTIKNKTEKEINLLKGSISFVDATGDKVGALQDEFDIKIPPNATINTVTKGYWEASILAEDVKAIMAHDFNSMTASFTPKSISFTGGEVLKVPDSP